MLFKNISLKGFNTFRMQCSADYMLHIKSEAEIMQFIGSNLIKIKPLLILGGGSNLLFTGDFHGIIIHPDIQGIYVEEEFSDHVVVSAGAGVNWDKFVEWAVNQNLRGIENLSYIPGTVGATPVQNIGAYGEEIKDYIKEVRAISLEDGSVRNLSNCECRFGYRDSIFKNELKGKYVITRVYFNLFKSGEPNLSYGMLKEEVQKTGDISLKSIRQAVIRIRQNKLPEPEFIGNAGSFFKNPVVEKKIAESLKKEFPDMPVYQHESDTVKLSAGWLIEQCGWKGIRVGDAGVYEKQALIIVNYGKATGIEILELSERIRESVHEKFGIMLEREVEVIE